MRRPARLASKLLWLATALVAAGCPAEDDDTETDASATEASTGASASSNTAPSTDTSASTDDSMSSTTSTPDDTTGDEASTGHHDDETGQDATTASETGGGLCDILGDGCHDSMTPAGIECHLVGHDGDEAACEEIYAMCVEACGLR